MQKLILTGMLICHTTFAQQHAKDEGAPLSLEDRIDYLFTQRESWDGEDELKKVDFYNYSSFYESLDLTEAFKSTVPNILVDSERDIALLKALKSWLLQLGCDEFEKNSIQLTDQLSAILSTPNPAHGFGVTYQVTLSKNVEESLGDIFETRYKSVPETFNDLDKQRFQLRNEMIESVEPELKLLVNMASFLENKGPRVQNLTRELLNRIQKKISALKKQWKRPEPFCAADTKEEEATKKVERIVTNLHKDQPRPQADDPTETPVPNSKLSKAHKSMITKAMENARARGRAEAASYVRSYNRTHKTKISLTPALITQFAKRAPGYCARGVRLAYNPYFSPDFQVNHAREAHPLFKNNPSKFQNLPLAGKKTTDFPPSTILVFDSCAPSTQKNRRKAGGASPCKIPGAPAGWIAYSGHITVRTDDKTFPFASDFLESSRGVMTGENPGVQKGINSSRQRYYSLQGAYYPK